MLSMRSIFTNVYTESTILGLHQQRCPHHAIPNIYSRDHPLGNQRPTKAAIQIYNRILRSHILPYSVVHRQPPYMVSYHPRQYMEVLPVAVSWDTEPVLAVLVVVVSSVLMVRKEY